MCSQCTAADISHDSGAGEANIRNSRGAKGRKKKKRSKSLEERTDKKEMSLV